MAKQTAFTKAPWYKQSFDLEGLAFGALAFVLAIFFGMLWDPLFWIFFAGVFLILFASRDASRVSPSNEGTIVAPCDGVVVDVSDTTPPRELRMDASEVLRVRLSSSPFSTNGVRSPASGTVKSFLIEPGSPAALSFDADNAELREAFTLIETNDSFVGFRMATGGLGPRLDIDLEQGDSTRVGRKVGVRRLGGWCDVYLPVGTQIGLEIGQSVIGGETPLVSAMAQQAPRVLEEAERPSEPAPKPVKPKAKPRKTAAAAAKEKAAEEEVAMNNAEASVVSEQTAEPKEADKKD